MQNPAITISKETRVILDMLENTKDNIFLTGRAGTGKSTLLKHFRATTNKNIVVLAPTGVAAVNVHGQTIHSFFKFRPNVTLDQIRKRGGANSIYKRLNTLVIDEVSMARADLFDCVQRFLELNGPRPGHHFGGVQIILIGDPYQLPPIVSYHEKTIFEELYESPFFFSSRAFKDAGFSMVELTHVYRQVDAIFIEALDGIRLGNVSQDILQTINQRVASIGEATGHFGVTLVTRNAMADTLNDIKLHQVTGEEKIYKGSVYGDFSEKNLPTSQDLRLKVGAQVMLLNNDAKGRWINGDIGQIAELNDEIIKVLFEDGQVRDVTRFTWEMVKFVFDDTERKINSEVAGSYIQFPIRLAWAVTIHKGQGKTFEKVTIDFGRGAFAPGQAYVALSRCKSLEGLLLTSPLRASDIMVDPRVTEFMQISRRPSF